MRVALPLLLAVALVAAVRVGSAADAWPRAALAWVYRGSVVVQDPGGRRTAVTLPEIAPAEVDDVTWLPDGRRVGVVRGTVLHVVDPRTQRVQSFDPAGEGPAQIAFARDGRIAIVRGPSACGPANAEALRLYVVDSSGDVRAVPVLPARPPTGQPTFLWLTELTWSARGSLSYLVHERRGSCGATTMRSTVVVTGARNGERPHAVASFRPWSSFAADTRWRADGRRIAYAFSGGANLVGAGDVAAAGGAARTARLRRNANTVTTAWVGSEVLVLVNDDGFVDVHTADFRAHRLRIVFRSKFFGRNESVVFVGAAHGGRYLSFDGLAGTYIVDRRTRRKWRLRYDVEAVSDNGNFLAVERGGRFAIVDVRTRRERPVRPPGPHEFFVAVALR
jgi:hypothetical protein